VSTHRNGTFGPEFIICKQTIEDDTSPEYNGDPGGGTFSKIEYPGCDDQQNTKQVIHVTMNVSGNKAHSFKKLSIKKSYGMAISWFILKNGIEKKYLRFTL
jgi:hypothetical protein